MRKFIIKNRPKRKYTKKAEQHSSLLFGKTFSSILPLLVMVIALMTTLVISSPTRMPLSNIHFSIALPQVSFQNPLPFLQALGEDSLQFSFAIATSITSIYEALVSTVTATINAISLAIISLSSAFVHVITLVVGFVLQFILMIIFNIIYNVTFAAQLTMTSLIIMSNEVVEASILIAKAVSSAALFVYQTIVFTLSAVGDWLWSVTLAISTWFNHTMQTIAYLIVWPFKALAAYLMQFKPITDTLGNHMHMALDDMGACFTNFNKTLHAFSSTN